MRAPRVPFPSSVPLAVALAGVVGAAVCASPRNAGAQTVPSVDARTWRPSSDADASLVLEPTTTPGPWEWNVGVWAQYAQTPVTLHDPAIGDVKPVAHQLVADVVAGIGLGDRAAIGFDVPIVAWQDGTSGLPPAIASGGAVPSSALGDLAILGKATIVSNDRQRVHVGFGLAALGAVTLPTGNRASFMGDGALGASLSIAAEYAAGVGALRASVGYAARTEDRIWPAEALGPLGGVSFGDAIPWAVGLVLQPKALAPPVDPADRQLWEIAAHGSVPAGPVAPLGLGDRGASRISPALLAVDDRIAIGHARDAFVLVGADIGMNPAVGVPTLRAVVAIGWAPRVHDRDADGVDDADDECPDLPEDRDGVQDADGCPEDDADGDGILDTEDACPTIPGVASSDRNKNGCPNGGGP